MIKIFIISKYKKYFNLIIIFILVSFHGELFSQDKKELNDEYLKNNKLFIEEKRENFYKKYNSLGWHI